MSYVPSVLRSHESPHRSFVFLGNIYRFRIPSSSSSHIYIHRLNPIWLSDTDAFNIFCECQIFHLSFSLYIREFSTLPFLFSVKMSLYFSFPLKLLCWSELPFIVFSAFFYRTTPLLLQVTSCSMKKLSSTHCHIRMILQSHCIKRMFLLSMFCFTFGRQLLLF